MKPVEEAVRGAGIAALIDMGCAVHKISGGKVPKHLFLRNVEHKKIGSKVKVLRHTDDSAYIAKMNDDGTYSDEDFTVVLATDLHVDKDNDLINKCFGMLVKHLEAVKPDLLILTGDIIVTDFQQIDCVQFARLMEEMGIYWAFVFGNHEARAEKEFHKFFMLKNLTRYEHCLSKFGPSDLFGYGNFFVNIMKDENTVLKSLAFFDSGRGTSEEHLEEHNFPVDVKGYDFIKKGQIDWYLNHIDALKKQYGEVKSMLFMHIPVPEYKEVMILDETAKPLPTGVPTGKAEVLYGEMHEGVGCSPHNSGLFEAAREAGAEAFFAGHDHVNDFDAIYKGVHLVYVQSGGYEEYSMDKFGIPESEGMQGVTIMNIRNNGEFSFDRRYNRDYL